MSLDLSTIFSRVLDLIAADPTCAPVPRIDQLDTDYAEKYATAIRDTGVVFTTWSAGGSPAEGNAFPEIRLRNDILLCVVENTAPGKNATGQTAFQWVIRLLHIIHHAGQRRPVGRSTVRLNANAPAYELGPMGEGIVVYFINLTVDSIEPVGPLPAPAP